MISGKVSIDLSGSENVKKSLVTKVIRGSVTRNSTPVLQAVKGNVKANKRTGNLFKSLTKKIKTYNQVVTAIIGPKSSYQVVLGTYKYGKKAGQNIVYRPSKIFHLVLNGARHFKGNNALEQARKTTSPQFASNVARDIRDGIERLAPN